jgi:hypothetical protein
VTRRTPFRVLNQPGLPGIGYRVGRHPCFKQSMLAGLSEPNCPTLGARLSTRADDDFAIALLDGAAMLADILTFYQERIANESYLRTATERFSVLQLARLVGYQLSPGVAASTFLAFTLEQPPALPAGTTPSPVIVPDKVSIKAGTKAQSIPGQDEQAQTFETVADLEAFRTLNSLRVYPEPLPAGAAPAGLDRAWVSGNVADLAQGSDLVVFADGTDRVEDKKVKSLRGAGPVSEIIWEPGLQQNFPAGSQLRAWTRKYRLYGHNLPDRACTADGTPVDVLPDDEYLTGGLPLDGLHEGLVAGMDVLVRFPGAVHLARIQAVTQGGVKLGPFSAAVTRLVISPMPLAAIPTMAGVRSAVVYQLAANGSEPRNYHWPWIPAGTSKVRVAGGAVERDRLVAFADEGGASHVAQVKKSTAGAGYTLVEFEPALGCRLETMSAVMLGNVAPATHGETTSEVLGSGDASRAYQRFTLRQPPLTYVATAGASGTKSTLEVRVNDQLWTEVPTLYCRGPEEHVFVTRTEDDGSTVVQFGDGRTGARLPSGRENVRARYRKGIGTGGMVKAGQVSLLATRPLGIKSVVNPVPGTDAEDPEPMENARRTAPLKVLTMGRAVSLQDYEDFALGFAGIAKALATWTWDGEQRGVFITVAGPGGTSPSAGRCRDLVTALHQAGDPHVSVTVEPCRAAIFALLASLKVQPDRAGEEEQVVAAARQAVIRAFSFEARGIGQAVALSEVIAVLQSVTGVQAVDVDLLFRWGQPPRLQDRLAASFPLAGERGVPAAAELLTLDPRCLLLKVMT